MTARSHAPLPRFAGPSRGATVTAPNIGPLHYALARVPSIVTAARGALLRVGHKLSEGRIDLHEAERVTCLGPAHAPLRATVRVHDPVFYVATVLGGSSGVAEAWVERAWDCDDLVGLCRTLVREQDALTGLERIDSHLIAPARRLLGARAHSIGVSRRHIAAHYDLSNEFFALFLDPTMTYSCGYFEHPDQSMEEASLAKIDRVLDRLELRPEHHLLEIGTGWGSLALRAASRIGCRVTTTTISARQADEAQARVDAAGLGHKIEILREDFRELRGRFDRLVSIEMIEAIGPSLYPAFFAACERLLAPGGRMLVQAITIPDRVFPKAVHDVDFIKRYIFPGGQCPSLQALVDASVRASSLRVVHLEDIGRHYTETLLRWRRGVHDNEAAIRELGFDEPFLRLWDFYLCYCAAGFAEGFLGDVQITLAREAGGS